MRAFVLKLSEHPKYAKVLEWSKLITIVGSAQTLIQIVGVVSGVLVIRLLSTQEYALYTIANTMLGTMTLLADGGITTGVISQGGKVWQDRQKLGAVLATGLYLRRKFAIGSLLVALPILFLMLSHHGASYPVSFLIILSLIPAFLTELSARILEIAPKLHQDVVGLQKIQMGSGLSRLLLIGSLLFAFPFTFVAILAAGLPQIWANKKLTATTKAYVGENAKPDAEVQGEILKVVKRILPDAIYYCLAGQITIFLVSIFGSTTAVAQVGALGRLSAILNLFIVLFSTLIVPRFSRMPANRQRLLGFYLKVQASLIMLAVGIIGMVWLFPSQVLWILGKNFENLRSELFLSVVGSCITLICGIVFSLYISRGWVIKPLLLIPFNVLIIISGAAWIDLTSIKGILWLNIYVAAIQTLVNIFFILFKINGTQRGYSK